MQSLIFFKKKKGKKKRKKNLRLGLWHMVEQLPIMREAVGTSPNKAETKNRAVDQLAKCLTIMYETLGSITTTS